VRLFLLAARLEIRLVPLDRNPPPGDYRQARGVLPAADSAERPEEIIRKGRGGD